MAVLSIFRGLVFAALAFFVVVVIAARAGPDLPDEVQGYLNSENAGTLGVLLDDGSRGARLAVSLLLFASMGGHIAALLGMLAYNAWARVLFIVLVPVALVLDGAMGADIEGPLESVMSTVTAMIDGAILTLLFVEPVRARFRAAAAPPAVPPPRPPPPTSSL